MLTRRTLIRNTGFMALMAGLPGVGRLFSPTADPTYVHVPPKEPIWPDRCTCALSVPEIAAIFDRTAMCHEHGGLWSYKCHACWAHLRASETVAAAHMNADAEMKPFVLAFNPTKNKSFVCCSLDRLKIDRPYGLSQEDVFYMAYPGKPIPADIT